MTKRRWVWGVGVLSLLLVGLCFASFFVAGTYSCSKAGQREMRELRRVMVQQPGAANASISSDCTSSGSSAVAATVPLSAEQDFRGFIHAHCMKADVRDLRRQRFPEVYRCTAQSRTFGLGFGEVDPTVGTITAWAQPVKSE
jgi:hypothetical protein